MSRAHNSTRTPPPLGHAVRVIAKTWDRDSHDLFDFESKYIHRRDFNVQSSSTFVRSACDVDACEEGAAAPPESDVLVRVVERSGNFWLDKAASSGSGSRKLWMVVRDIAPKGQRLSEEDVIKLGRFKFRVRQLVTCESGEGVEPDLGLDDTTLNVCHTCDEDLETKPCRICLMEGPGEDDPLLKPCQCKGSIEYVHLKCLRYWTKSRLSLGENPLGSYSYKPLPCELCKTTFPTYMSAVDGTRSPLMALPTVQPPYIVLESMVRDAQHQHSRNLHVMSLAEKPLTLGRGHESDLRVADVSISRCHASIRFEDGQFLLKDKNSKFGTLIAMRRPHRLEAERPVSVQIGRSVLSFFLAQQGPAAAAGEGRGVAAAWPFLNGASSVWAGPAIDPGMLSDPALQRSFRLLALSSRGRLASPSSSNGGAGATGGQGEDGLPDISGSGSRSSGAPRLRRGMSF